MFVKENLMSVLKNLLSTFSEEQVRANSALNEYKIAISLMQYHTNLLWLEFGAFSVVETLFVAILGQMIIKRDHKLGPIIFISAIGFFICLLWWSTFKHNYAYYKLRVEQARRLESDLGFTLLEVGRELSRGDQVIIDGERIQFCCLAKILPPRCAMQLLIFLFAILFIVTIILTPIIEF
jgi:hypothetical protein